MNKTTTKTLKAKAFKIGQTVKWNGKKIKLTAKVAAGTRPTKAKYPTLANTGGKRSVVTFIGTAPNGKAYWVGPKTLTTV